MNKRSRDPSKIMEAKVAKRARLLEQVHELDREITALAHPIAHKMAIKLFEHLLSLYNSEQFYMDPDCCVSIMTLTRKLEFDWIGTDDDDVDDPNDHFMVRVNYKPLQTLFDQIFEKGYFGAKERKEEVIEKLTSILADLPDATLKIDNWGDDCPVRGGKIGKETNGVWEENSTDSCQD
jgi:hypothetical protein